MPSFFIRMNLFHVGSHLNYFATRACLRAWMPLAERARVAQARVLDACCKANCFACGFGFWLLLLAVTLTFVPLQVLSTEPLEPSCLPATPQGPHVTPLTKGLKPPHLCGTHVRAHLVTCARALSTFSVRVSSAFAPGRAPIFFKCSAIKTA
jgi:hypothetical protein